MPAHPESFRSRTLRSHPLTLRSVRQVSGATVLVFVLPHQFLPKILPTIKANMDPGAVGISLIKGMASPQSTDPALESSSPQIQL